MVWLKYCLKKTMTLAFICNERYYIFRFLEFFPPVWCFVFTSVLIRVLHAAGNALVITSTFTYAAFEFNKAVGQIFVSSVIS